MCNQTELQELLGIFAKHMRKIFGDKLKKVILFGSYARGDYDAESDVDVMVLVDMDKMELKRYAEDVCKATVDIDTPYDVLLSPMLKSYEEYNKYKPVIPFLQNVEREGVNISA